MDPVDTPKTLVATLGHMSAEHRATLSSSKPPAMLPLGHSTNGYGPKSDILDSESPCHEIQDPHGASTFPPDPFMKTRKLERQVDGWKVDSGIRYSFRAIASTRTQE